MAAIVGDIPRAQGGHPGSIGEGKGLRVVLPEGAENVHERQVILNKLAQGIRPMAEGEAWFTALAEDEQSLVLKKLVRFCVQARAVETDAQEAIARSGMRPTYTPAVMLTRWRLNMSHLPPYDRARAFRLLVALFAIADNRRRERYCADGCSHAWHQLTAHRDEGPAVT
ncbi:DUF5958 family protein [Streptomyces phaeochromogenes]|uniref:DUF5958 family protein n=1 Tax=Streptomyces phaeochromogenes TaxID=1923 RepID=UPI00386EEE72|nr:DUF5958 family protein [Streptomyces phaeochromogenes]